MSFDIDPRDITLRQELGSGSFGKVYSGTVYGSDVAIKVPKRQDLDDDDLAALVEEVEIWRQCPHPNIVQLLGACMRKGDFRIVTEKLDGDLEGLIHDKEKPLSLYTRMCMARDIALGMNWLHNTKPAIIHRDLKLGNVLYRKRGNWFEIKVADFGLAQLKPRHVHHLRDSTKGAVGTPLYMAPEVMLGRPFNEKADVYAFGVCLWEIVMREDPFQEYKHYEEFVKAVAEHGARPHVPKEWPSKLRKVMQTCWHQDPAKRPSFGEVAEKMLEVIIQCAIDDKYGRKFWTANFLSQYHVPWATFVNAFYSFIGLTHLASRSSSGSIYKLLNALHYKAAGRSRPPSLMGSVRSAGSSVASPAKVKSPREDKKASHNSGSGSSIDDEFSDPLTEDDVKVVIAYRCLRAVIARQEGDEETVEINWFGDTLKWFGPLTRDSSILDTIRVMLRYPWFHGPIDSDEAKRRLSNMPAGTFLVRFSLTTPGSYTISRVLKPGKVLHSRMQFVPGKGFTLDNKRFFPNLSLLVSSLREPLELKAACGGSQYTDLFKVVVPDNKTDEQDDAGDDDGEESYKEFSSTILKHVDADSKQHQRVTASSSFAVGPGDADGKEKEASSDDVKRKKGDKPKKEKSDKKEKKKKAKDNEKLQNTV